MKFMCIRTHIARVFSYVTELEYACTTTSVHQASAHLISGGRGKYARNARCGRINDIHCIISGFAANDIYRVGAGTKTTVISVIIVALLCVCVRALAVSLCPPRLLETCEKRWEDGVS